MKYYVDDVFAKSVAFTLVCLFTVIGGSVVVYRHFFPVVTFVSRFPEMWYPRQPEALRAKVETLLTQAEHASENSVMGACPWLLFVPHAGYDYSGAVAAAGYRTCLKADAQKIERVIILSPSHYVDFNGMALPPFDEYQNPLGTLEVDNSVVEALKAEQPAGFDDVVFHREHAIDVQLPWIQTCFPHAKIVPLIVGRIPDERAIDLLASALVRWIDRSTLIVVSTDLVHYGKRFGWAPFTNSLSLVREVEELETRIIDTIVHLDRQKFEQLLDETGAAVCGKNVIRLALEIAKQALFADKERMAPLKEVSQTLVLARYNSAQARHLILEDPEKYESVGYGAIAAFAPV